LPATSLPATSLPATPLPTTSLTAASLTSPVDDDALDDSVIIRSAGPGLLARALEQGRGLLLQMAQVWQDALGPALQVPVDPVLNPPLWELGHIGWFEGWWFTRNPGYRSGRDCPADVTRRPPLRPGDDERFDSTRIAHEKRWALALGSLDQTIENLAAQREQTLALLGQIASDDAACYFPRLILFHEDMHREAWVYMAQTLGIDPGLGPVHAGIPASTSLPIAQATAPSCRTFAGGTLLVGRDRGGFMFDNELGEHTVDIPPFSIDTRAMTWARFLPFVEAGGYEQAQWWDAAGWAWRIQSGAHAPRYLMRGRDGSWDRIEFGVRKPLDEQAVAVHLNQHEARAWCAWAGRRLPSEFEWEFAIREAARAGQPLQWGEVWEWTASRFAPWPGFVAHPYREYSEPWFDGRPVLRGASWATAKRMRDPRYRNYFTAERNDILAGFRSAGPV
jgi:gamma-glutamyl hercynylcysteine S-oxide synthase